MEIKYRRLTGPEAVRLPLLITQGKTTDLFDDKPIKLETWKKLIMSCYGVPHSPIRASVYRVLFLDIPSWVAVHYVRHHVGVQPYVMTQRTDNKDTTEDRGKFPQDTPVNMLIDINVNSIIDIAKARLCLKAAPKTREIANALREELLKGDEYDIALGEWMAKPCDMYGQCFEPSPCMKAKVK